MHAECCGKVCKPLSFEIRSSSDPSGLSWVTKLDKTQKLCPKVAVYKKPEEHTGAGFKLGELLYGRSAMVCPNKGEELEGFTCESIAVVLPLQMPDLENKEYVCVFLCTREMESFLLSNGVLDPFYIDGFG